MENETRKVQPCSIETSIKNAVWDWDCIEEDWRCSICGEHEKDFFKAEEQGMTIEQYQKFKKAEKILKEFSTSNIKAPCEKNNPELLDTKAFSEMSEVKKVIKKLQDAGIKDSSELGDLGFVPACLVIRFGFEKPKPKKPIDNEKKLLKEMNKIARGMI